MSRLPTLLLGFLLCVTLVGLPGTAGAEARVPPSGTDLDYQLGGPAPVPDRVGIVVRDRRDAPLPDRYNVCYVNGFQTQPDERRFWSKRSWLVLHRRGAPVVDQAWGEWLLDIRTARKRRALTRIVGRWTARCAKDGYQAVEYDNLDSYTRSHGMLRRRHAVAFARGLVRRAHRAGLAAGQKNLAGFDGTRIGYDFAVAEECGRYDECGRYVDHFGAAVLAVEYRPRDFRRACRGYGDLVPVVLRDRALAPDGRRRWC